MEGCIGGGIGRIHFEIVRGRGKTEGIHKMIVVGRGVISREKKGSASWSQLLIVSKVIASWLWLVSLLGEGAMGIYTVSPILKGDNVGLQDIYVTHYDIMFVVIKDVSDGLWDAGLFLLQGTCAFWVEATTSMVTASLDISILGVVSGRQYKGSKMLRNYPSTR